MIQTEPRCWNCGIAIDENSVYLGDAKYSTFCSESCIYQFRAELGA